MDVAALLLLVSGTGVGFGWQPMPDGSPRSEFVVQIEPEMLDALAEGQSIPIVGEVPQDIGPIARVRVLVGRGDVPRERIQVRCKPAGDATEGGYAADGGDSGVVLTQYTEPAAPRYGQPAGSAVPYGAGAPAQGAYDPYTQVAPSAGGSWNPDDAPANPLRTAAVPDAAAAASAWNNGAPGPAVGDQSELGPLRRMGAELQEAAQPLQQGLDRVGDRVRTAADNLGDRTGQLLDELGRPLRPGGSLRGGSDAPAAPPVETPETAATTAPAWNGGDAGDFAGSAPTARGDGPSANWNNDLAGSGPGTSVGATSPNLPADPAPPPLDSGGAARGTTVADPWANAEDPRLRTGASSNDAAGENSVAWPGSGPAYPDSRPPSGGPSGLGGPQIGDASGSIAPLVGSSAGMPAVTTDMLQLPSNRVLEGVDPGATAAASMPSPNVFTPATAGPPAVSNGPLANAQGWDINSQASAAAEPAAQKPGPGASDARHKAAVILAWVLLSGSAAGNIYLFWSYLDVRTKYRALVRKTARAVGSRFSPA